MLGDLGRLRPSLLLAAMALGTPVVMASSPAAQPPEAGSSGIHEGTRGDDTLAGSGADDVITGRQGTTRSAVSEGTTRSSRGRAATASWAAVATT